MESASKNGSLNEVKSSSTIITSVISVAATCATLLLLRYGYYRLWRKLPHDKIPSILSYKKISPKSASSDNSEQKKYLVESIVKNTSRILEDLYDLDKLHALDAMIGGAMATPSMERSSDIVLFKQSLIDKLNKIIYYLNSDINNAAAAPAEEPDAELGKAALPPQEPVLQQRDLVFHGGRKMKAVVNPLASRPVLSAELQRQRELFLAGAP